MDGHVRMSPVKSRGEVPVKFWMTDVEHQLSSPLALNFIEGNFIVGLKCTRVQNWPILYVSDTA